MGILVRADASSVKSATTDVKDLGKAADDVSAASVKMAKEAKAAAKELENVGFQTAGAKRELLVLAHEMATGQYTRFAGSLMVLGERTNAMALVFTATGAVIGGVAAVIGLAAYGIYKMQASIDSLNKSLILTGNFAGQTRDSIAAMGASIQSTSTGGLAVANHQLATLAGTGQFTSLSLASVGKAATSMAHLTGQSAEDVAKFFAKMGQGVAKFAEETNSSMHYLTVQQYEHIRLLEEQGRKQEAMKETADAMTKSLNAQEKDISIWTQAWRRWGQIIDQTNASLKENLFPSIGQQAAAAAAKLADLRRQLTDETQRPVSGLFRFSNAALISQIEAQEKILLALSKKANEEKDAADAKEAAGVLHADAISASDRHKRMADSMLKGQELYNRLTRDYYRDQELIRKAGDSKELDDENKKQLMLAAFRKKAWPGANKEDKTPNFVPEQKEPMSPIDALVKSTEKAMETQEHWSALKKFDAAWDRTIAEEKAKNDEIELENTRKKAYNTLWDLKEGDAKFQQVRKLIDANKELNPEKQAKGRANTLETDTAAALDLQKRQISDLDKIVEEYNNSVSKSISLKHETTQEIAAQSVKNKIELELEKELAEINKTQYPEGEKKLIQEKAIADALERKRIAIQKVDVATQRAADAEEQWGKRGVDAFITSLGTMNQGLEKLTTGALQGFTDSLTNLILTGKGGFKDMVASMIQQLVKLIVQMMIMKPIVESLQRSFMGMGFSWGSGASSIPNSAGTASISTFAADGAEIMGNNMGRSILVGEKGPEMFTPKGAGTITPNAKLQMSGSHGGTVITNSFQVNVTGATDPTATANQITQQVKQMQQIADNRMAIQLRPGGMLNRNTTQAF